LAGERFLQILLGLGSLERRHVPSPAWSEKPMTVGAVCMALLRTIQAEAQTVPRPPAPKGSLPVIAKNVGPESQQAISGHEPGGEARWATSLDVAGGAEKRRGSSARAK